MKQTKGAMGNLINRYRAVLQKCHLLNTFGSLALASMLVLGGTTVSVAEDLTITDVVGSNGRYDGTAQETLTFDASVSTTSHFDGVATGFGTIAVTAGTTVSVANLCTGDPGNDTTGGGFWANAKESMTVNVTGQGTIIAEHVSINTGHTIAVSGNLTLINISEGIISELEMQQGGSLIVKSGGSLDVTGATKVEITDTNFTLEAGATLRIRPDSMLLADGDIGSVNKQAGIIVADNSVLHARGNETATGNIYAQALSVKNDGTVRANGSINVLQSISDAHGSIVAGQNIEGTNISKASDAPLTLQAGATIKADTITATNVTAQTLNAQEVTVDGGSLNLVGAGVKHLTLTNGTQANIQGTLSLQGTGSVLAIGSHNDATGGTTLAAQNVNLRGGMLLADPAWGEASSNVAVESLSAGTGGAADVVALGGKVGVGQNSYMAIGTSDTTWLPAAAGSLSESGTKAALGLFKPITIDNGNALVVNGTLMGVAAGTDLHSAVNSTDNNAVFASNTLLVVNGNAINSGTAAITFASSGTIDAAEGSEVLITDAVSGQTYTLVANTDPTTSNLENWTIRTTTDMLSPGDAAWTGNGTAAVTVTRSEASNVFPGLSGELAGAVNALYGGTQDVNSTSLGVRFLSRATDNRYLASDKAAAVEQMEGAARIAVAGAVPQMTRMAADSATNAVVNRLGLANPNSGVQAINAQGELVPEKARGLALWIAPLWQNQRGFGMEAGNLDYGYSANLGGVSLGADYTFENAIRAGLMFHIGGGYAQSQGDLYDTTNSMSFWGIGAYGGWEYNNFAVMADVSYTSTWNNVKQDLDSRMDMGSELEADIQAAAISAGLRAEYKLETSVLDLIPHVGVRYMNIRTWGYDVDSDAGTVLEGDGFTQNIWTFPVGVTLSKDIAMSNGWSFKPSVDFTVIPAAGDIKAKEDVRFTGLPGSYEFETQMMDYLTWQGGVGVEFGNDTVSIGLNYTLQAGQNSTGHGVFGMFRYEF